MRIDDIKEIRVSNFLNNFLNKTFQKWIHFKEAFWQFTTKFCKSLAGVHKKLCTWLKKPHHSSTCSQNIEVTGSSRQTRMQIRRSFWSHYRRGPDSTSEGPAYTQSVTPRRPLVEEYHGSRHKFPCVQD